MPYLLFSKVRINISNIALKRAVCAFFIIGFIYSYCMDIFNGQGWTKTILIDFQNERLLIHFMAFLLGSLCFQLKTFESKWTSKKLYIIISCTAWIPITLYLFIVIYSIIITGKYLFSEIVDALLIRFSFLLSLLCLLYLMINTFRYYLNIEGKIRKELNKNSYYVYIIHLIVIGSIALTMLNTAIPSLVKYLILTVSSYIACNVIITSYRKVIYRM
ncbi:MAG: hypothetical protein JSV33_15180 [bacterium]|nr:MAG: hypothetical protein JSV33_15180 [bacterium]